MTASREHASQRVSLLPVFLIVLVDVFGMTLVIPLLAIYAETLSASPLQATMLVSVYAAFQLVSGPIIGQLSDRFGRKPLLLLSQIGTFVGFVLMARAQTLWVLYIARMLDGATAGNLSLAQAYISDHTEPAERARSFGLIGIAFGVGFFIGPSLTGELSARYSLTTPIYLAACMSAASVLCTAALLKGGQQSAHAFDDRRAALHWKTYVSYFRRPGLSRQLMQFLFFVTSFSMFLSGFALFAERRFTYDGQPFGPREIGYVFGYVGLISIVLQGGLLGRMVRRFGEATLVATGFVTLVIGYFVLGLASSITSLLWTGLLASFGISVIRPALTSLITQQADRREQGVVLGLTQSLTSMASIVAPIVAGLLIGRQMLTEWAWIAAGLAAVGVALSLQGFSLRATRPVDPVAGS